MGMIFLCRPGEWLPSVLGLLACAQWVSLAHPPLCPAHLASVGRALLSLVVTQQLC